MQKAVMDGMRASLPSWAKGVWLHSSFLALAFFFAVLGKRCVVAPFIPSPVLLPVMYVGGHRLRACLFWSSWAKAGCLLS
jgi:hypothetical protein